MRISIDYERIRLLRRTFRSFVRKLINQIKYDYPGPVKATLSNSPECKNIEVLWKGKTPERQTLENRDWKHIQCKEEICFTDPFVIRLREGRVFGKRGDIITKEGILLTDICPEIPRRKNQHFLIVSGNMPTPIAVEGRVMVLSCGPYHNYFHFTCDAISRLRFFQEVKLSADYYCMPLDKSFHRELATIFGIDKSKIIPLEKDTHIMAKELIVTSLPGNHTHDKLVNLKDKDTYRFLRDIVLPKINQDRGKYSSLIYIQRKGKRTVENELDILKVLEKFGDWQVVRLEEHSVLEQAAIFYHAKMIVALHGAGLTNIIYCQSNVKIIEILNPNLFEPLYFYIAHLLGFQYHSFMANENHTLIKREKDTKGTVSIDPKKLESCLTRLQVSNPIFQ